MFYICGKLRFVERVFKQNKGTTPVLSSCRGQRPALKFIDIGGCKLINPLELTWCDKDVVDMIEAREAVLEAEG